MIDYKNYNDFELHYLACQENEEAYDIIYQKYRPLVESKARQQLKYVRNKGLDFNDLVQEGMIGLSEAIRDFKTQKDVKFSTFATLCIERQIKSAIVKANRLKHKSLNESLSLDDRTSDDDKSLLETTFDTKEDDPMTYLSNIESEKELYDRIIDILTPLEQAVFKLKIANYDYKEIAKKLKKSYKSVDSTLQRIRIKIKAIINN